MQPGTNGSARRGPVKLALALGLVVLVAVGAWMIIQSGEPDPWSVAPASITAGSPAEVADAYLEAVIAGDAAAAYALSSMAGMDEEGFAQMLSENVQSVGGVDRYLILGQEIAPADDGGGEMATVWAAVGTGRGDLLLDVYLRRGEGEPHWRVTTTNGAPVGSGGFATPPEVNPQAVPLESTADRLVPIEDYEDALLEAAFGEEQAGLPVIVSPKIELAFVVTGLGGSAPEVAGPRTVLGPDAMRYFRDYRDHDAVTAMAFLHQRGLSYDAITKYASCFSDPPDLEQVFPFGDYLCSRTYGMNRSAKEARLLDLGERLGRFYVDAGFEAYLEARREDYDHMLACIRAAVSSGIPGKLKSYYGTSHSAYVVVVSAFSGNYALVLADGDRTCAVAVISGSMAKTSGDLASDLWSLLTHEWSHTLVKPALQAHSELIDSYNHLYPPLAEDMSSQAYGSWRTAVEEHIIRAAEARMILAAKGLGEAERFLANQEANGFRYIRLFYERLAEYENDRETYPTFHDFVPRLLSALGG